MPPLQVDGFWADFWFQVGISPAGVLAVVLATAVMYSCFALVVHLSGPRLWGRPSVLSFSVMALLGGLCARAMLGNSPTMAGALVAVATLLGLEATLGRVRWAHRQGRRPGRGHRAAVVMVDGEFRHEELRHRRLSEAQLLARLRAAGILSRGDVALVVLERRGGMTIVRQGQRIDRELLRGVSGADELPAHVVRD